MPPCLATPRRRRPDRVAVGDVERRDVGLESGVGEHLGRLREFVRLAAVQDDGGAGLRQAARDAEAQSAIGAGDKRDAAGKVEQRIGHGIPRLLVEAHRAAGHRHAAEHRRHHQAPMTAASTMPQNTTTSVYGTALSCGHFFITVMPR